MIAFTLALLTTMLGSQAGALERQDRQDTIYEVRGEPGALRTFDQQTGVSWTGGVVLDNDPSDGTLTYWAYSDRTAAEARALMMPAIMGGLELRPEQYSEAKQFPSERGKLDQLATKCGVKNDPYFLTPKKSVEITLPENVNPELTRCLTEGVKLDVGLSTSVPRQGEEKK